MIWAEIAVSSPLARRPGPQTQTFTYQVPAGLALAPGHLVRVPFRSREVSGVVVALSASAPGRPTRPVAALLDPRPALTPHQLALARWVADYYCASLAAALQLMLPAGLQEEAAWHYHLAPAALLPGGLPEPEAAVVELLRTAGELSRPALEAKLPAGEAAGALERLVERGLVQRELRGAAPRVRPKMEKSVRLLVGPAELAAALATTSERATQQRAALSWLLAQANGAEPGAAGARRWLSAELRAAGHWSAVPALAKRGLVAVEEVEVRRDPLAGQKFAPVAAATLTPAQAAVWREIEAGLARPGSPVYLLHGVTASGKTELYLRLVEAVLARGRQAIVLVPEIALTPQTVRRFAARFPGQVAVLHSQLSAGERFDEWRRVRDGAADVVVGSRSAVFAPLPRLGAIVVDEEHEWSYKQDRHPHYHARDVAIRLGELTGAPVVLGSATPDVVTYARAQVGRYRLLELPERVAVLAPAGAAPAVLRADAELPPVEVVDLRAELRAGNRSLFSRALQTATAAALARNEQVIYFLNRRGSATFVICRDCGLVLRCRRCDASLVYHSAGDDLLCHLCNRRQPAPERCPGCGSTRIQYFGVGTQRVEDEARRAFPQARVIRWDRDVARTRRAHEDLLRRFQAHEADLLVGTQMVAKGLDLPLVTLVGVVTADTGLHLPDLRSAERTFQLLTQVAGRAGRGARPGRAIVQSYTPEHYCIQAASRHDYAAFAAAELRFREQHGYPPYNQLVRLLYAGAGQTRVAQEAGALAQRLREQVDRLGLPGVDLLGPAPAYQQRVRGRWRWQLIARGRPELLSELLQSVELPLGWSVDVDPVSLL